MKKAKRKRIRRISPRGRYLQHRDNATARGKSFELTLEEWITIWTEALGPNYLSMRGHRGDQYCMARLGDKGPYKVGNVKICTNSENAREQRHTAKMKILKSIWNSGEGNPFYGRTHSEATKAILREKLSGENSPVTGIKRSEETKAKMRAAWVIRKRRAQDETRV
jgi:hypothetical protein